MKTPRFGSIAASVLVALALAPTAAAVDLPPTLSGEFFSASPVSIRATCNPGSTSTLVFSASGTAYGPYPGTFTEIGIVTIGPTPTGSYVNGVPLYQVTSVNAAFTIRSSTGRVAGTKQLVSVGPVSGLCNDFNTPTAFGSSMITGTFRELNPDADGFGLSYSATIKTGTGYFADVGTAGLLINQLLLTSVSGGSVTPSNVMNEAFRSSGTSVTPVSGLGT